jgi:hypothetical protein
MSLPWRPKKLIGAVFEHAPKASAVQQTQLQENATNSHLFCGKGCAAPPEGGGNGQQPRKKHEAESVQTNKKQNKLARHFSQTAGGSLFAYTSRQRLVLWAASRVWHFGNLKEAPAKTETATARRRPRRSPSSGKAKQETWLTALGARCLRRRRLPEVNETACAWGPETWR